MPVGIDLTDVDEFTDPVNVIADGESENSANKRRGWQSNANRTRYLKNRLPSSSGVANDSLGFSTTSATPVDVTGLSVSLTCGVGDILEIRAMVTMQHVAGIGFAGIAIVDGGTPSASPASSGAASNLNDAVKYDTLVMIRRYQVSVGGTVTAKVQGQCTSGSFTCAAGAVTVTRFPKL
jgi:hypothetical protein